MSTPDLDFHLEWQTYPVWTRTADGGSDNPDPHDLDVPAGLADEIVAYSDDYDALWDPDDPGSGPRFAGSDAQRVFQDRGRRLAERLAAATGARVAYREPDGSSSLITP